MSYPTPFTSAEEAILKTICYADMFSYPLTLDEIHQGLFEFQISKEELQRVLTESSLLRGYLNHIDDFYLLQGREALVTERKIRQHQTRELLNKYQQVINTVIAMPFVRMVAFSGATSFENSRYGDDIDLFIIAEKNRAWTVNFGITLFHKLSKQAKVLCHNFIIDTNHYHILKEDLFTAHQVISLKPIFGYAVYRQFLDQNQWIHRFFPNARCSEANHYQFMPTAGQRYQKKVWERILASPVGNIVEHQLFQHHGNYLRKQIQHGKISGMKLETGYLKKHSNDHKNKILTLFEDHYHQVLKHLYRP